MNYLKFLFVSTAIIILSAQMSKANPGLIIISAEGIQSDMLENGNTPVLDSLINAGVYATMLEPVFPPLSFPVHMSLMTGLYPENHGIIANRFEDKSTGEIFEADNSEDYLEPKWYSEETFWKLLKKNNIITASHFWSLTPIDDDMQTPDYYEMFDSDISLNQRVDLIVEWLQEDNKPEFIAVHVELPDRTAHTKGTDSDEFLQSLRDFDGMINYLLENLRRLGLEDQFNLIILSPYGHSKLTDNNAISIKEILETSQVKIQNHGAFMMLQPAEEKNESKNESLAELFSKLSVGNDADNGKYDVYTRAEVPEYLHYSNNQNIDDILLIAKPGYIFSDNMTGAMNLKTAHGYNPKMQCMNGMMIASGPAFKKQYRTAYLMLIDIYSVLCEIYGLPHKTNKDSNFDNIKYILKR